MEFYWQVKSEVIESNVSHCDWSATIPTRFALEIKTRKSATLITWATARPQNYSCSMCPHLNPFQSNVSATRILPSSYLFWAGKRLVNYLSVLHEEKRRTGSDSGVGERKKKTCRTSSDIGAEQENHNVGRGPTLDRKELNVTHSAPTVFHMNFMTNSYYFPEQYYLDCCYNGSALCSVWGRN
jgi:hypothetical protein